jgi:hypothetical protein
MIGVGGPAPDLVKQELALPHAGLAAIADILFAPLRDGSKPVTGA